MSQYWNLKERLIILDRDGVINYDSVNYIRSPEEWIPIPGSLESMARLHIAGFRIAIATNQSGIGRGYYTLETLHAIHQKMQDLLAEKGGKIDVIFYCPHLPTDNCECRKPKPGLLKKIGAHFQCSLDNVPFIGDSLSDVQAAQAIGAAPVFLKHDTGFDCLSDVVDAILRP